MYCLGKTHKVEMLENSTFDMSGYSLVRVNHGVEMVWGGVRDLVQNCKGISRKGESSVIATPE